MKIIKKNPNKLNYDYIKNYKVNNPNLINIMQPHKDALPKLPRRLSPIKNQNNNQV